MTAAVDVDVAALMSAAAWAGGVLGAGLGLAVGWTAGRWRRAVVERPSSPRRSTPGVPMKGGQVVMGGNQPRPQLQARIPDPPPRGQMQPQVSFPPPVRPPLPPVDGHRPATPPGGFPPIRTTEHRGATR